MATRSELRLRLPGYRRRNQLFFHFSGSSTNLDQFRAISKIRKSRVDPGDLPFDVFIERENKEFSKARPPAGRQRRMGKVTFDISMSVDGYITGTNVRLEAGLGDGGERLHEWFFKSKDQRNLQIVEEMMKTGVIICGRTTYNLSVQYWGADGPIYAMRTPVIIVSHSVPSDVPAGSVYTFVDSIEAAYEKAQELAGDKVIGVQGVNVVQQFLARGLIDEIGIHLVPVLFGSGTRLFDNLGEHVALEPLEMIATADVTHLLYRVVKES
jgi:dihydrofolate reductase